MNATSRFTIYGDEACERLIRYELDKVVKVLLEHLDLHSLLAIVLIGGYGRGEGGVQEVNGKLQPHNNYDFLIVLDRMLPFARRRMQRDLFRIKSQIRSQLTVDVDFSFITRRELQTARFRLLLCDAKHSSRVLWGEPEALGVLPPLSLEEVPLIEGLWLLLNRGTLLLINEKECKENGDSAPNEIRLFRHIAKAIIGCGDAVLIGLGAYHWSYLEKRNRLIQLETQGKLPVAHLGKWYSEALEWRLKPGSGVFFEKNYDEAQALALELNKGCYLWYEKLRCGYLQSSFHEYGSFFKAHLKSVLDGYVATRPFSSLARVVFPFVFYGRGCLTGLWTLGHANNWLAGFRWGLLPPRDRLLGVFPELAFSKSTPGDGLGKLIGLQHTSRTELLSGFLNLWGKTCA